MINGTMIQFFHWYTHEDVLWKELKDQAGFLAAVGITSVWLPPASKGAMGGMSVGYDAYDLFDLGEFDQKGSVRTKYGTKEELLEAVKSLKDNGIQVIIDVILNHKAGGDEVEQIMAVKVHEMDRNLMISEPHEIEAHTLFTFPGRGGKYSEFIWNHQCFSGCDYNNKTGEKGIYSFLSEYGDDWEEMIDREKGNYDYLMFFDIESRNPAVREEIFHWLMWMQEMTGFDGVRLDAVKHVSPEFLKTMLHRVREATGKEIFAVGECWTPKSLATLDDYIKATEGSMDLFDAVLQDKFHKASNEGNAYDLSKILENTLVDHQPEKAVTLVTNHDTQPLQASEAPVEPWFKPLAYALILLREGGFPCVFYPDLYGASYKDQGEDGNEYEIFLNKVDGIETMLRARQDFAFGTQRDYFDHPNCIGWTREGNGEHSGCAVVMSNSEEGVKDMEIGGRYAGRAFRDAMGKVEEQVVINEAGWGQFRCAAGSVSVWIEILD